jgi:hypothetical protein
MNSVAACSLYGTLDLLDVVNEAPNCAASWVAPPESAIHLRSGSSAVDNGRMIHPRLGLVVLVLSVGLTLAACSSAASGTNQNTNPQGTRPTSTTASTASTGNQNQP